MSYASVSEERGKFAHDRKVYQMKTMYFIKIKDKGNYKTSSKTVFKNAVNKAIKMGYIFIAYAKEIPA